jgi:hypothetical protein
MGITDAGINNTLLFSNNNTYAEIVLNENVNTKCLALNASYSAPVAVGTTAVDYTALQPKFQVTGKTYITGDIYTKNRSLLGAYAVIQPYNYFRMRVAGRS